MVLARCGRQGVAVRLLILLTHPAHMSRAEARTWLVAAAQNLGQVAEVHEVRVTPLHSPASCAWPRRHDFLIELRVDSEHDAEMTVRHPVLTDLLGDLKLLGMHPDVAQAV